MGAFTFESIRDRVEAGDLVPLLRITEAGTDEYPRLIDIPVLEGPAGLAARVGRGRGGDAEAGGARAAPTYTVLKHQKELTS